MLALGWSEGFDSKARSSGISQSLMCCKWWPSRLQNVTQGAPRQRTLALGPPPLRPKLPPHRTQTPSPAPPALCDGPALGWHWGTRNRSACSPWGASAPRRHRLRLHAPRLCGAQWPPPPPTMVRPALAAPGCARAAPHMQTPAACLPAPPPAQGRARLGSKPATEAAYSEPTSLPGIHSDSLYME